MELNLSNYLTEQDLMWSRQLLTAVEAEQQNSSGLMKSVKYPKMRLGLRLLSRVLGLTLKVCLRLMRVMLLVLFLMICVSVL